MRHFCASRNVKGETEKIPDSAMEYVGKQRTLLDTP